MAAEISKPDFSYQWSSGGAIVAPSNVKIQTGWTAEVPPFQWENYLQNRQDNAILHLFQKGISEWDAASNYYFTTSGVRSYVQGSDGQIYVAVADSLNNNPTTDTTNTYWKLAFSDQSGSTVYALDTGVANAYKADFSPAVKSLVDGMVLRIKVVNPNNGASTFTPSNGLIPPAAVVGGAHSALQGGEFVTNGDVWLQWNTSVGGGSWVVIKNTNGGVQVAPATKSQHAVQLGQLSQIGSGQSRLIFVNTTSVKLTPFNGNNIIIGGVSRQIPSAGVTLTNASLSASTLYYVYASWNGTAIILEASATTHTQDSTYGVEIKTGDTTRSLVGMVYMNASSQFADAAAARHVASWFNRRSVGATLTTNVQVGFTSTSFTEVSATHRVSFLTWGDEAVDVRATGQMIHGSASQSVSIQSFVDGVAHGNISAMYAWASNGGLTFASTNTLPLSGTPLAEGQHLAQVFGAVPTGGGAVTQLANSVMMRI